jgi:hypothetical protein
MLKAGKRRIPKALLPVVLKLRSEYLDYEFEKRYRDIYRPNPCIVIPEGIWDEIETLLDTYNSSLKAVADKKRLELDAIKNQAVD